MSSPSSSRDRAVSLRVSALRVKPCERGFRKLRAPDLVRAVYDIDKYDGGAATLLAKESAADFIYTHFEENL